MSDKTKDYKVSICCFSVKHAVLKSTPPRYNWNIVESGVKHHQTNKQLKSTNKNWLGIRMMCPSEPTYLPANFCYRARSN